MLVAKLFGVVVEELNTDNIMESIRSFCDSHRLTLHDLLVECSPEKKVTLSDFINVCCVSSTAFFVLMVSNAD